MFVSCSLPTFSGSRSASLEVEFRQTRSRHYSRITELPESDASCTFSSHLVRRPLRGPGDMSRINPIGPLRITIMSSRRSEAVSSSAANAFQAYQVIASARDYHVSPTSPGSGRSNSRRSRERRTTPFFAEAAASDLSFAIIERNIAQKPAGAIRAHDLATPLRAMDTHYVTSLGRNGS